MQAIFANKKDLFSSWLILIFSVTLLVTAGYTKYFHIPGAKDHNLERIRILFSSNDLENVEQMELRNRLGTFVVKKFDSEKMGQHWLLTSPRRLMANSKTINNVLSIIEGIRIKKVYPKDAINLANFSLTTPNIEIKLIDKLGSELDIGIGLINPIDNSTYLMSSDSDAIFHIQALPSIIEKLNFSDFIESNMSSISFNKVEKLHIYKRDVSSAQLSLSANKDHEWSSREGRLLDRESVSNYYDTLMNTQSYMLLDVTNEEQKAKINEMLEKPLYKFIVTDSDKKKVTYKVSSLINNIPGIKIERRKYVLIQSSLKDYPYVYNKDILKNFYKTQYSFKRRPKK